VGNLAIIAGILIAFLAATFATAWLLTYLFGVMSLGGVGDMGDNDCLSHGSCAPVVGWQLRSKSGTNRTHDPRPAQEAL
jgi:hypothetical protein